ncbi:MAG: NAD-dependent epimerase/dehydratase family protein [Polyangiaceae bacterium]
MSTKVMVTDATGLLGSRLVRMLVERGEHVRAFVRATASTAMFEGLPEDRLDIVQGDIRIEHTVYRGLAGCNRLYHVAGHGERWSGRSGELVEMSELGTAETLRAALKRGIEKVVVTTGAAALGATDTPIEMNESTQAASESSGSIMTALRKAEKVALEFSKSKGLPVVIAMPGTVVGPGDFEPSAVGEGILRYLAWTSSLFDVPSSEGGVSLVDADDAAAGHIACMERGESGERYLLGGENVTYDQFISLLSDTTGLPGPGTKLSSGALAAWGKWNEARAAFLGGTPLFTADTAKDFGGRYVWVSSVKAQRALGFETRNARQTMMRAVQWFLAHGKVPGAQTRRRIEARAMT